MLDLLCCVLSLVGRKKGSSRVVGHRLRTVAVPLVDHGLSGSWAAVVAVCGLGSFGSLALGNRLSNCASWA